MAESSLTLPKARQICRLPASRSSFQVHRAAFSCPFRGLSAGQGGDRHLPPAADGPEAGRELPPDAVGVARLGGAAGGACRSSLPGRGHPIGA